MVREQWSVAPEISRSQKAPAPTSLGPPSGSSSARALAYELMEDPSSLTDTTFWTFTTEYGDLDVVLRPAGFPRGYDDLVDSVVIVRLADESDPGLEVDAFVADVSAIYTSKRRRPPEGHREPGGFTSIHPINGRKLYAIDTSLTGPAGTGRTPTRRRTVREGPSTRKLNRAIIARPQPSMAVRT